MNHLPASKRDFLSFPLTAVGLGLAASLLLGLPDATASERSPGLDRRIDAAADVAIDRSVATRSGPAGGGVVHGTSERSPAEARRAGIAWLEAAQLDSGGWGAGGFGHDQGAVADVATTSMAVLALVRDGGVQGPHRAAIERGVGFIVQAVEDAPKDSPRVATPSGTQPQGKLGQLVDTHMAALALGQVAGELRPDLDARTHVALDAVIGKVQQAQRADGSFDGEGWAPVLSNSVAAMSLVQAQKKGVEVGPEVMAKADRWQDSLYDESSQDFSATGSAGVELYSVASNLRMDKEQRDRGVAGAGKAEAKARQAISGEAADRLIAGFGSVGGEEMLSYMMISDTLAEDGGEDWEAWDGRISGWLSSIQNTDGSWAGHHCITSRTFVTATALLTLGAGEHAGRAAQASLSPLDPDKDPGSEMVLGTPGFGVLR